jgi:hypothetical protein
VMVRSWRRRRRRMVVEAVVVGITWGESKF